MKLQKIKNHRLLLCSCSYHMVSQILCDKNSGGILWKVLLVFNSQNV